MQLFHTKFFKLKNKFSEFLKTVKNFKNSPKNANHNDDDGDDGVAVVPAVDEFAAVAADKSFQHFANSAIPSELDC